MRYLGILALTVSLTTPALAKKHHAARKHPPAKHAAHTSPAPLPVVARADPAPPPRADPPPRASAQSQENDDEVPGQKQKK
jgi:hypothetical protein